MPGPDSLGCTSLIAASSTGLKAMPGAQAQQQHAGQHVHDEAAVDRRAGEQQQAHGGDQQAARHSGRRMPKRIDQLGRQAQRETPP